jgi:hypothetical protein
VSIAGGAENVPANDTAMRKLGVLEDWNDDRGFAARAR